MHSDERQVRQGATDTLGRVVGFKRYRGFVIVAYSFTNDHLIIMKECFAMPSLDFVQVVFA